jgi:uncharacterized membrane protein
MASSKQARTPPRSGSGSAARAAKGNGGAGAPGARPAAQRKPAAGRVSGGPSGQKGVPQDRLAPQSRSTPQNKKARDRARARELAEASTDVEPVKPGPPFWLQLTSLLLSIAGLGVSIYMTIEHFTGNRTLACSSNSIVNCQAVTTSPESMVFGVFPVAVLGLAFFVAMVVLTTPWAWRMQRREVSLVRLGSTIVGVGFIIYLIYVELYQVGYICLECTSVHVLTFALFVVVALASALYSEPKERRRTIR